MTDPRISEQREQATDIKADPARPVHGLHPGVIVIAMLCVAVFLLGMIFFVTGNLAADLNLFGVAGFAVIFFALTLGLAGRAAEDRRWGGPEHESLSEFARDNMATLTGVISGREAIVEVLVIPVTLAFGMVAIGFVFAMGL
jgi:hypothetical protein